jgi:aryl-alcohol dehydrogenase-like predicted oxidoreductase
MNFDSIERAKRRDPAKDGDHVRYRHLGNSGLKITEITYGNWLTHGSQVENDAAIACVRAALDVGISTFDTADVYADTAAEVVLGEALRGVRRESLEIFTKTYFPVGPGGANDSGLSRKHIMESIDGSLRRLGTDYVDLYQAHRWDDATPLEETMLAFADIVRSGKALYIGVSEWTADQLRAGAEFARELQVPFVSNQPQYSALWRVIEEEVVPVSRELGISQIVWSPVAQGVLTGKYRSGGSAPAGTRAADGNGGSEMIERWMRDDVLERVQRLAPIASDLGLTMAQLSIAWVLQNDNVAAALIGASRPEQVTDNAAASGIDIPADAMAAMDEALGDVVERDPAKTADESPTRAG